MDIFKEIDKIVPKEQLDNDSEEIKTEFRRKASLSKAKAILEIAMPMVEKYIKEEPIVAFSIFFLLVTLLAGIYQDIQITITVIKWLKNLVF